MVLIKGIIITYKPKDSRARTLLNHTIFGRIVLGKYREKKLYYYIKGILDEVKFCRLLNSKTFIANPSEELKDKLNDFLEIFGTFKIYGSEREEQNMNLKTGREYWYLIAREKGIILRDRKNARRRNRL